MYKRSTTWGDVENQFFNREKTNALKKSMKKDEIEKEMIDEIFTRERVVYDKEKGKKIIVKERIDLSLNHSTKLREKEFHERNKANLMEKSSRLLRLSDQRHAEKCTFQPTIIKKNKKKGKLNFLHDVFDSYNSIRPFLLLRFVQFTCRYCARDNK
jgi:hypothetical protein